MSGTPGRHRFALVGAGARAEMFVRALVLDHPNTAELVAFADVNQARMNAHNDWLAELGFDPVSTYPAADFGEMLAKERVDVVLVTSVDRTHDEYIVAALRAGCDVITEKPMTIDAPRCERILRAVAETGRKVSVAFNYRYNPLHEKVREVLAEGTIGEIGSVHFEWLLDVRHGADYFRRWHRDKANSGGLMVHKASHHFDLVNWWLDATPVEVYAAGRLFFYGEGGRRHGYARDYDRAHGAPDAADDPFALHLAEHPRLRALYLDAEAEDGYHRDQNVFAPGVTIEDDMAVLARYSSGASMSYHLTAYAPWEGYRVMFNGSRGRLELEVVESDFVSPQAAGELKGAALHGVQAAVEEGWAKLTVRPFWEPPREVPVSGYTRSGHGGADARMTAVLFGGHTDPMNRAATARDGALALLTGLAANRSFETGQPVRVADLLTIP
ncbi:Gfo/Idh/MocA family oxidoreductase [Plantactinospora sp. S1510]|uniref:Gfo/Idh/MocA family oxidoreductase n=1 Tax=Plantactinospora alkalitolerans TaxID=2789879 RepID=A0ABS0H5X7_9ACTN|nr:Gfo/Idh/MocA family oxidoreductase [Plantactinospora alkalitolerans]MBF9133539.1 Gfo/Idh/MocA family oxidoreductase [Plantactinospora alkalitolerans]